MVVLIVTDCAELYAPAGGLNVGVATMDDAAVEPVLAGSKNRPLTTALNDDDVLVTRRTT